MNRVEIFDTTLRDGLQVEGVTATVDDKLRIAEQLDHRRAQPGDVVADQVERSVELWTQVSHQPNLPVT